MLDWDTSTESKGRTNKPPLGGKLEFDLTLPQVELEELDYTESLLPIDPTGDSVLTSGQVR